ncbi:MAG: hypothetical protein FWG34_05320 [Oscillospiraceae bacterium]|nr:hypothetical protein [Oscillospiraceae bacterium]
MEELTVTNENRPSNYVVFGLVFEDRQIFRATVKCVLGDELDDGAYVVSEKENRMGSAIYNKIRFDVYGEGDKIYSLDMQNGYAGEMIRNRLVYYACRAVGGQEVRNFGYDALKTCVVTFIFERGPRGGGQLLTRYYMAAEIDGAIVKYSDLLSVVELNLGLYKATGNANLNVLCEFLRVQTTDDLRKFREKHGGGGFGEMLYGKYMKVAADAERIEKVSSMQLYEAKSRVKYLSESDVNFLWEENQEKLAINAIKKGLALELISELTELDIERIKKLKEQTEKNHEVQI